MRKISAVKVVLRTGPSHLPELIHTNPCYLIPWKLSILGASETEKASGKKDKTQACSEIVTYWVFRNLTEQRRRFIKRNRMVKWCLVNWAGDDSYQPHKLLLPTWIKQL